MQTKRNGFFISSVEIRRKMCTFASRNFLTMKIREVVQTLEMFAPLPLQEGYDNAGLQIGLTDAEVSGVLLCLDVTEAVIREAVALGCNMVVAHHPLLFRGLKCVSDATQVERCVREAILNGVAIYASHTNLDNALGGVNYTIAEKLGLQYPEFLLPQGEGGSGVIGVLPQPMDAKDFLQQVKSTFAIECLMHNQGPQRSIQRVALCGGSGDFLLDEAIRKEADVFLTGEMSYHHYFGREEQIWIGVMGHYQSEKFTIELLHNLLHLSHPDLKLYPTTVDTNPIHYLL